MSSTPSLEGSPILTVPPASDAPPPERRNVWRVIVGAFVAVGLLLLKLKGAIFLAAAKIKPFLANPFEGFGVAQFAVTAGSMILSLAAYAVKMGVPFAIGFIAILVIHEVGHALTIRAKGLRAGAMVFIPFIGGAVTLRRQPRSAFVDAQIGLGGPIAGTFASGIALLVFQVTSDPLWLALAFAGFLLNLFNLTPVGPLDGGRIAGAITKWMWTGGALILLALLIRWRNPLLLPILLLGVWQIWHSIVEEKRKRFYNVTLAQRATIAVAYFSLVLILGYESIATYRELMALQTLS